MQLMGIQEAMASRHAVRAFTSQPVARTVLETILEQARRAPSGTNTQPWRVYVLQGTSRDRLCEMACAAHDALRADPSLVQTYQEAYDYYPSQWVSPYLERRRQNGLSLYGLLGIGKDEHDRMHAQQQRNFRFFDAPVGLMFTIDTVMGRGSLLDYGMFLQNVMLAARGQGLDTCPQASWNKFATIVLPHIGAGPNEMLVCGMALGYADAQQVVNQLQTPREPVEAFTRWLE